MSLVNLACMSDGLTEVRGFFLREVGHIWLLLLHCCGSFPPLLLNTLMS